MAQTEIGEFSEPSDAKPAALPAERRTRWPAPHRRGRKRAPGLAATLSAAMDQEQSAGSAAGTPNGKYCPNCSVSPPRRWKRRDSLSHRELRHRSDAAQSRMTGGLVMAEAVSIALAASSAKPPLISLIGAASRRAGPGGKRIEDCLTEDVEIAPHLHEPNWRPLRRGKSSRSRIRLSRAAPWMHGAVGKKPTRRWPTGSMETPMDETTATTLAWQVRKQVLGEAHVEASLANRNPFNEEFQELITRYAWGEIWTRPGFDMKRGASWCWRLPQPWAAGRSSGCICGPRCTAASHPTTSRKCCSSSAIYAGVPAANTGFHIAREMMKELGNA